jgi:arylsulfatase A-like enzyme
MMERKKDAPNILLILADQLRYDYVGAYGVHSFPQTPHLDSLAREGWLYENAYSPNPACIPARHNMITGLPARYHGFDDNYFDEQAKPCPWNLPTFAQILSDCGYATAAFGKMHFQPPRRAVGFDIFENCDEVVRDISEDDYAQHLRQMGYGTAGSLHGVRNVLYMQPQQSLLPEELHSSSWVADRTIRYLTMRGDKKRPFLICAGFIHPHPPFDVPPAWAHRHDGKLPPPVRTTTPLSALSEDNKCLADLPDRESLGRMRELYACAVSFMDCQVGRILKSLEDCGEKENTLVLFLSDHGEMLGDLGTYQKFLPYDASCRIPFLVRWPGHLTPGRRLREFVDLNDILPTLLDVAGTAYPASYELPGESLFARQPRKDRGCQYVEYQHGSKRWCSIRDRRYKYVHYYGDEVQLFDLCSDPEETQNLLYGGSSLYAGERDRLRAVLLRYEGKYGLPGGVVDEDFVKRERYTPHPYRERCYPSQMIRYAGDPPLRPLTEEILEAVRDEPSVKLSRFDAGQRLVSDRQCSEEAAEHMMASAKKMNRY